VGSAYYDKVNVNTMREEAKGMHVLFIHHADVLHP
jgi:hypothetical protein